MRVVSLTRTSSIGPSTRYRIEQYRPLLAAQGIRLRTLPLFGRTWFGILAMRPGPLRAAAKAGYALARLAVRLGQLAWARARRPDVLHVEQQLFPYLPARLEWLLWPRGVPTILEFDDAIHLTRFHRRKLEGLCARASLVIVGNRFLAGFARPHARALAVVPTTVDSARYAAAARAAAERRARHEAGTGLRVVWIGLAYNLRYLSVLAGPLRRLAAEAPGWELVVVSSALPQGSEWAGVPLVLRRWSEAGEAEELGRCDVGVMPLPDDDWARGKCGLKLLQCMAAGLPVVASPVGVNADIVEHGENGLLAADEAGWEAALAALAADRDLAARLAEAGRRTVAEGYDLAAGARSVAEAYRLARGAGGSGERDAAAPPPP